MSDKFCSEIFVSPTPSGKLLFPSPENISAIVTIITSASAFYQAEEYHQDFYKKNPIRYKFYRYNCGRDNRLNELWGNS